MQYFGGKVKVSQPLSEYLNSQLSEGDRMRYFGGKQRISEPLSKEVNSLLQPGQTFVDAFCGACNITTKIDKNRRVIANDVNPYLVEMWKALQDGWIPPQFLSEEEYNYIRQNKDENLALTSFVGFGCSYAGKFFGGYARSNPKNRNYCMNAYNSTMRKLPGIKGVEFYNYSYDELLKNVEISDALIYCDIPYKNTTGYSTGRFSHEAFYLWCKDTINKGNNVLVSEYKHNVPDDAVIVYEIESTKDIRNKDGKKDETVEVLFTYERK